MAAGSHKTSITFLQNTGYNLVEYETLYFQSDSEVICGIRVLVSKDKLDFLIQTLVAMRKGN